MLLCSKSQGYRVNAVIQCFLQSLFSTAGFRSSVHTVKYTTLYHIYNHLVKGLMIAVTGVKKVFS